MRNVYKWLAGGAVLSALLLAGCDAVNDAAQKVRQDAHEIAAAAGSSVVGTGNDIGERLKNSGEHIELSAERELGSETVLQVDHKVGSIKVGLTTGNTASVKTTIWFMNEKSYQNIVEQAETSLVASNGKLEVVTNPKGSPEENIWDWAQSKYGYSEMMIDYEIQVPASITGFEIRNDVGGITMTNLSGIYAVSNQVGEIVVTGAHIQGSSSIESEAGSVQLAIGDMGKDSTLKAKTKVGSIHASLSDTLACTLKLDSELGIVSGAPKGSSDINGGGPLITLSSSVGAISIE